MTRACVCAVLTENAVSQSSRQGRVDGWLLAASAMLLKEDVRVLAMYLLQSMMTFQDIDESISSLRALQQYCSGAVLERSIVATMTRRAK